MVRVAAAVLVTEAAPVGVEKEALGGVALNVELALAEAGLEDRCSALVIGLAAVAALEQVALVVATWA